MSEPPEQTPSFVIATKFVVVMDGLLGFVSDKTQSTEKRRDLLGKDLWKAAKEYAVLHVSLSTLLIGTVSVASPKSLTNLHGKNSSDFYR